MITIRRKYPQLESRTVREWNTHIDKFSRSLVNATAKFFQTEARSNCPVDTGRLKKSIGNPMYEGIWKVSDGGLSITVGTHVPYSIPVERGVPRRYTIMARNKKALAFEWRGKWVVVSSVVHPAMRGKFYMRKAAASVKANTSKLSVSVRNI